MLRHGLATAAILACALTANAQGQNTHARESAQRGGSTLANKFDQFRQAIVGKPKPAANRTAQPRQQPYGSSAKPLHAQSRFNGGQPRPAMTATRRPAPADGMPTARAPANPNRPRISTGNGHYLDSAPEAMQTESSPAVARAPRAKAKLAPVRRAVDPFQDEALLDEALEASSETTDESGAAQAVATDDQAVEETTTEDQEAVAEEATEESVAAEEVTEETPVEADAEFTAPRAATAQAAPEDLSLPEFPTSKTTETATSRAKTSRTASSRTTTPTKRATSETITAPRATVTKTARVGKPAAAPVAATVESSDVLTTREGPALAVVTKGPRTIAVGKPATYTVSVNNAGGQAATDVVVVLALPEWADVSNAKPSAGVTATPTTGGKSGGFEWRLNNLAARGMETMTLEIVPLRSAPLDLAVRWSCAEASSNTTIEVQEPKLEMALKGPQEVDFGKKDSYQLTLSNPGNGDAENVTIILYPMTPEDGEPATHKIGTLRAGESKSVDVELTARQSGQVAIRVAAKADGGLQTETSETVTVRRAELKIDVQGPENQYAGTPVEYEVHVSNPGNSAAEDVTIRVELPADATCLSSSNQGAVDETSGQLTWDLGSMAAGEEQVLTFKCELATAGTNRVEVDGQAAGELTAASYAVTEVEALADLVLEVVEPDGPIAVGKDAVFQIKVSNRGTKAAENVEVVGLFSNGIEPTSVEGSRHEISPGRVMMSPIASLAPGQELVISIKARAEVNGNHHFRAELNCEKINVKLTQQETTLYYGGKSTRAIAKDKPKESPKETTEVVAEKPATKIEPKKVDRR